MKADNKDRIKSFLKDNVYFLDNFSSSGKIVIDLPDFEIHPREFLIFAERELDNLNSTCSIVNCVSNLKRAVDCQIDIFLYSLNLLSIYKARRLGVDRKLGFIERCGLFSSRSLSRMNTIRNKLEHHYSIPKIEDILVYFDLVNAFILVLESMLTISGRSAWIGFNIVEYLDDEDLGSKKIGYFESSYCSEERKHEVKWYKHDEKEHFVANDSDLVELAEFIKVHVLLKQVGETCHGSYANLQLEKL